MSSHGPDVMFNTILLCTHGSEGAQRAEQYAFTTLLPQNPEAALIVLTIIDKDWTVMTGDDWLNTSTTRNRFLDYVDEQIGREIDQDWQRIRTTYAVPENTRFIKTTGDIEETIAHVAKKVNSDIILVGGFRKKPFRLTSVQMSPGLAARIANEKLHPLLPCPLLTVS